MVSIIRYWSPSNSLTGIIEVTLSPSDRDKIWVKENVGDY